MAPFSILISLTVLGQPLFILSPFVFGWVLGMDWESTGTA